MTIGTAFPYCCSSSSAICSGQYKPRAFQRDVTYRIFWDFEMEPSGNGAVSRSMPGRMGVRSTKRSCHLSVGCCSNAISPSKGLGRPSLKNLHMGNFGLLRCIRTSRTVVELRHTDNRTLSLTCFMSSEPLSNSPARSLKREKLNISCNGQGPCSDNLGVENLRYESTAENFGQDLPSLSDNLGDRNLRYESHAENLGQGLSSNKTCLENSKGSYSETNGASYEGTILAQTEVEDAVDITNATPWWQQLPKRWLIVLLCFFAFLLCNMDRVNMSIAILPMSAEFHWNHTTVGLVQSSFFWGYLLTQIAGGIWADSIGGKTVLGFGVLWWSLATVATPIAAKLGLPFLLLVRAFMGIGEGVAMPAMNNMLSKWVPVSERSRSLALVYSGMYLGSVTGLAFSPSLIQRYSWASVFFSFGSLGAIWFIAWQRFAHSSPHEDPEITEEEKRLILGNGMTKQPASGIPWKLLLSKAPVWALIVCHFCHNWGTFILLTWMPTYYCQVLKLNLMESGMFSVLPWLTMALSANVGGWIADTLVSRGTSVTTVRKVMQTIGFLGPAFFLSQLSHVGSPALAILCMTCSQGMDAFSQSGLYSNHQDIGPRYAGVLLGLSNTAGVLAGVIGTAATGYILQHGTWDDVFKVAVGLYLFGTVVWNLFSTGEQIFD